MLRKSLLVLVVLVLAAGLLLFVLGKPRQTDWTSDYPREQALSFPKDFYFGTASAAQQVESQSPSDWTAFEQRALRDGKTGHGAEVGIALPGNIHGLDQAPAAARLLKADYDRQFAGDFALANDLLHNNAYRFSFEWARLFPREDMLEPDPAAIAFYDQVLDELDKQQLTPFATLFHFSSPEWFWREVDGRRGWERADAQQLWERYVSALLKHFGPRIRHWITLNEPMVYLNHGYREGFFPPLEQRHDPLESMPALVGLAKAHAGAYHLIKQAAAAEPGQPQTWVGIAQHTRAFEPWNNWNPLDRFAAAQVDQVFIWDFLDALETGVLKMSGTDFSEAIPGLAGTQDYVGLNYYGRFYVEIDTGNLLVPKVHPADPARDREINDLGWAHYPKGLGDILRQAYRRYEKPIYILENGTADARQDDQLRDAMLISHLAEIAWAIEQGVPVQGYFHWSLTDNFEWAEGFLPRFGLIEVDYANTFARHPRKSAATFGKIAGDRQISVGQLHTLPLTQ